MTEVETTKEDHNFRCLLNVKVVVKVTTLASGDDRRTEEGRWKESS